MLRSRLALDATRPKRNGPLHRVPVHLRKHIPVTGLAIQRTRPRPPRVCEVCLTAIGWRGGGFDATSVADLEEAVGLQPRRGSLYKALREQERAPRSGGPSLSRRCRRNGWRARVALPGRFDRPRSPASPHGQPRANWRQPRPLASLALLHWATPASESDRERHLRMLRSHARPIPSTRST